MIGDVRRSPSTVIREGARASALRGESGVEPAARHGHADH
jgi:hypothetical protein